MKTLEELQNAQMTTDIEEVVYQINDDMNEAAIIGEGSMYEFMRQVVNRYYPPNPFERIFGTPKRRNEIAENTEGA